jgi:hypothetical protein
MGGGGCTLNNGPCLRVPFLILGLPWPRPIPFPPLPGTREPHWSFRLQARRYEGWTEHTGEQPACKSQAVGLTKEETEAHPRFPARTESWTMPSSHASLAS